MNRESGPGWGTCGTKFRPRRSSFSVANAVFTRVSLRLATPEHVAPGVHDNVRCRRDDVRHCPAWHRPHGRLHHGIGFSHCGIAYQSGMAVAIPAALSAALLIGLLNGFLISRLKLEPLITTLAARHVAGRSGWRRSDRSLAHPTFEALGKLSRTHPDSGCDCGSWEPSSVSALRGRHLVAVGGTRKPHGLRASVRNVKYIVYMISARLLGWLVETARLAWAIPARSVSTRNSTRSRPLLLAARPLRWSRERARTVVGALIMQVISTSQHPHSVHLVVGFEIRNHSFRCFSAASKEV